METQEPAGLAHRRSRIMLLMPLVGDFRCHIV